MQKTDFKKQDKQYYTGKPGRFDVLCLPNWPFLMIDGTGTPGTSPAYIRALGALYALSYNLKFQSKKRFAVDYVVGPLEGLWWAEDMSDFITRKKENWLWTMMIRQPDWLTEGMIDQARVETIQKLAKKKDPATDRETLENTRFQTLTEGKCVQVLHIGSYDDEGPILKEMHEVFIPTNGFKMTGKHHEIYLGDPRRVAPEKLKTILRQPVI